MPSNARFSVVILFLCTWAARGAEWANTLQPVGKQAGPVALVRDGIGQGSIAVPSNPTPQEQKAAADLQEWIAEITGARLAISTGATGKAAVQISTDQSMPNEAYAIAVSKGKLLLAGGRTRGVVNAVYALLEEDLGCRFYANDSIRLPKTNTLVVNAVPREYAPRLKLRDPFYASAFDAVWSLRNRSNAPDAPVPDEHGGHMDYANMFVHTAAQMTPADKYYKKHPEYFAMKADGARTTAQLCATHPEVAAIAIDYIRGVLRGRPHTEIVSVSKNDNTEVCHCERCKKLRQEEGSDMAVQLVLVNKVAEALEQDFPELIIDTLAYLETIGVPKTVRPRKNVAIRLCNDSVGSWIHPFTPAAQCEVAKLAVNWAGAHHRIYVWDYNVNFSHYLAPMPNIGVMASNIRFWVSNNAEGVMLQGGYQGPAERDQLKSWVTAKLLWDPGLDEKALTRDFILGHYGRAAEPILAYEHLLDGLPARFSAEMASPSHGIRYPMDSPFFTKDFISGAEKLFAGARLLADGDEALVRRVDRARLPILYVQCARGPEFTGERYGDVVAEFERIARREKVTCLQEGGADFEPKLASYKERLEKSRSGGAGASDGGTAP